MIAFPVEILSAPPTADPAEVGFSMGSPTIGSGAWDNVVEMSIQELSVSDLPPVVSPWPEPSQLVSKGDWHSPLDLFSPRGMHLLLLPEGQVSS